MYRGYSAPYKGLPDEGYNGFVAFRSPYLWTITTMVMPRAVSALSNPAELVRFREEVATLFGAALTMSLRRAGVASGLNRCMRDLMHCLMPDTFRKTPTVRS